MQADSTCAGRGTATPQETKRPAALQPCAAQLPFKHKVCCHCLHHQHHHPGLQPQNQQTRLLLRPCFPLPVASCTAAPRVTAAKLTSQTPLALPVSPLPALPYMDALVAAAASPTGNVKLVQAALSSAPGKASLTYFPVMPGNSTLRPQEKWQLQGAFTPNKCVGIS